MLLAVRIVTSKLIAMNSVSTDYYEHAKLLMNLGPGRLNAAAVKEHFKSVVSDPDTAPSSQSGMKAVSSSDVVIYEGSPCLSTILLIAQ